MSIAVFRLNLLTSFILILHFVIISWGFWFLFYLTTAINFWFDITHFLSRCAVAVIITAFDDGILSERRAALAVVTVNVIGGSMEIFLMRESHCGTIA